MRKVHENIEIIRKARGMSKRELANRVGIPEQKLGRYMWGSTELPADMIAPMAKALGVETAIFFDDTLTDSVSSSDLNNDIC